MSKTVVALYESEPNDEPSREDVQAEKEYSPFDTEDEDSKAFLLAGGAFGAAPAGVGQNIDSGQRMGVDKPSVFDLSGFDGIGNAKPEDTAGNVAVPPGTYVGRLTSVQQTTSQSSGNPMIVFEFKIVEGQYRNATFWLYCALTEKARFKFFETMRALYGLGSSERLTEAQYARLIRFNEEDILGKLVDLVVINEIYEGEPRHKLKGVRKTKLQSPDPMVRGAANA